MIGGKTFRNRVLIKKERVGEEVTKSAPELFGRNRERGRESREEANVGWRNRSRRWSAAKSGEERAFSGRHGKIRNDAIR